MMDAALVYLGAASVFKQIVYYLWHDRKPNKLELVGHVTKLCIYPVKSAREVSVDSIECSPEIGAHSGVIEDRKWMVVDGRQNMVTISGQVRMHRILPRYEGEDLVLASPQHEDITVVVQDVITRGHVINTKVITAPICGLDCGDAVALWLDNVLENSDYRLIYCGPQVSKRSYIGDQAKFDRWTWTANQANTMAYQNDSPILLNVEQSVADLNTRLDEKIDILQLRANIIVSSLNGAYDEDTWKDVFIGSARLCTIMLAARCPLITVDRETITRYKRNEPLRTLKSYRSLVPGYGPMLGLDMAVQRHGSIHVGDPIYVIRGNNI